MYLIITQSILMIRRHSKVFFNSIEHVKEDVKALAVIKVELTEIYYFKNRNNSKYKKTFN